MQFSEMNPRDSSELKPTEVAVSLHDCVQIIKGNYQGYCGPIVSFSDSHKMCTVRITSDDLKLNPKTTRQTKSSNQHINREVRVRVDSVQLWKNPALQTSYTSSINPEMISSSKNPTLASSTITTKSNQTSVVASSLSSLQEQPHHQQQLQPKQQQYCRSDLISSTQTHSCGSCVKIIGGKHQGCIGYVLDIQSAKTYRIQIQTSSSSPSNWILVSKRISSLEFVSKETIRNLNTTTANKTMLESHKNPTTYSSPSHTNNQKSCIQQQHPNIHLTNTSSVWPVNPEFILSNCPPEKSPIFSHDFLNTIQHRLQNPYNGNPMPSSKSWSTTNSSETFTLICGNEWNIPDSHNCGLLFGRRYVTSRRLSDTPMTTDVTLLTSMFQSRVQVIDIPIRRTQQQEWIPMERELYDDGRQSRLQLVSTKIYSDPTASFGVYSKPKVLRCVYLAETFPGCQTVSAEQELRKIANFAALDTRKAMARLELLQSPAFVVPATARTDKKHGIFFFPNALDVCTRIDDPGCAGCGFIAESLLMEMFYSLGKKTLAKRVYAIQVRFLVPTMGIYKGMLCRKRISHGPPIQLPDSMWKVPPSTSPDASIGAALLICRSGVHPKTGTTNYYIGRRLDANAKCPLQVRSFQPKPLSDMILRLFQALQVHPETIRNYRTQSITREGVNHAWLIGLADPTGSLPVGHVYVTGSGFQVSSGRVFVTRSPCMKPNDGRILPIVHQKPDRMSEEDWNTIQAFPFGGIIFANPEKRGMRTIPEYIANGDLDGDLYFTCWDRNILQEIQAEPIPQEPLLSLSPSSSNPPIVIHQHQEHPPNWFLDVQTLMMNVPLLLAMDELTSKCYRLSQTIADQHPDLFMGHPDAIAFASAYNQALEYTKHGGQIYLPKHLHNLLPQHLLPHVTDEIT